MTGHAAFYEELNTANVSHQKHLSNSGTIY